jgi:hypothetical protein
MAAPGFTEAYGLDRQATEVRAGLPLPGSEGSIKLTVGDILLDFPSWVGVR